MALLMICSEHCLYVDLREHGKIFPSGFQRNLNFFFPEMYSHLVLALQMLTGIIVPLLVMV